MAFVLVRNAMGPEAHERGSAVRAGRPAAAPVLRQVPRHRHRRRHLDAADQGQGAGRARHDANRLVPCRACRTPGRTSASSSCPSPGAGGVDRVRGRRRLVPDLDRLLLARQASCPARRRRRPAASSPRRRTSCCSTTTDDDDHLLRLQRRQRRLRQQRGDARPAAATRSPSTTAAVSINDDAFKVT